jgi:hypothetical protein
MEAYPGVIEAHNVVKQIILQHLSPLVGKYLTKIGFLAFCACACPLENVQYLPATALDGFRFLLVKVEMLLCNSLSNLYGAFC